MTGQIDAFRFAAEVLDDTGVLWWLSDGSVLGAVREGRLLPWDPDVDLGVWCADIPAVRAAFVAAGWSLKRDRPGQLWPTYAGVKVDIHGHQLAGDVVWYELSRGRLCYQFDACLFDALTSVTLHDVRTHMPCPPEDYLVEHYGHDWRTPRQRWRWNADPPCLKVLR